MGAKWMWSEAHQSAFETVKRALESELALAHYDPRLSTVLTVDASPTGLARVLAQQQEDGSESDSVRFSARSPQVLAARDRRGHQERSGRVRRVHGAAARPGPRATRALAVHLDMLIVAGGPHLVVVDAHSTRVEWAPLADGRHRAGITAAQLLGRFGLPRTIVTDNATPFTSARFRRHCEVNDIKHIMIPPYHPASNGQAEMTVKLIKRAFKTLMSETNSVSSLEHQVNKYLLSYRNSVHSTTGVSPAQLMLGRNVRTRLDLLCPLSKETRRSVITLARWRRRLHSGHPQAAYEHYNSDESDDDYTFVKMQSNADDRARQTEIETATTRGADRADERQSAEDYGEELNISKNDSNTTSSLPEGGEEGGDTVSRGYDSVEDANEDAYSAGSDPEWTPPPHHRARLPSSPSKIERSPSIKVQVNLPCWAGADRELIKNVVTDLLTTYDNHAA
ncbi:Uncharacterized protein K02A2.6 [Eumeta japonica]|uniref:Uncharacterized protein K02A2.6 n=1 Tax=Eumeta variegata TaxID=151549 RepID=A0A4C1SEW0_EUMVA|nr:Uncharacterized protein K02A2.6 [Eumeta japonica]